MRLRRVQCDRPVNALRSPAEFLMIVVDQSQEVPRAGMSRVFAEYLLVESGGNVGPARLVVGQGDGERVL